ncbi:S41 family peptidase [Pedobacter sp. D749]|uniref:S41 family peptidase n=1 Tax=Pedobacter sp. D749 TaxID=2856523 RepID=UPI001C5627AF|nr:S41 family peptidase [Pedobacter sp. D749]QXU44096.1 S41 family peptidase [Pedobacter sp. D749]
MKKILILLSILIKFTFGLAAQSTITPPLESYLGIYSSKKSSLKITISKNDTTLIAQANGQNAFPLEARAKDQFMYYKAGIELLFDTSKGEMTVNQDGDISLFIRDNFTPVMGIAQNSTIYQPEDMQADLNKFKGALIKTHPGLYTNQSPEKFEKTVDKLMSETSKPLQATDFYKIVLKMIATIHDDHTSVKAFNHLGDIIANQKWLPFQIYVKDERIFVVNNLSNLQIPEGSEILAIDDHLSNEILSEILKHFSSDGISESPTLHKLGVSYFTLFGKIYPQIFGEKVSYNISYRDYKSNKILTAQVEPLSEQNYIALKEKRYPLTIPSADAFNFTLNKQRNHAIIKINRFFKDSFHEPENTFPDYYKKCFKEISANKIKNLIIDLRDNSGGKAGNAAYLLQYFIDKPIIPAKEKITLGNDEYFLKTTGVKLRLNEDYGLARQMNGTFKVTKYDALRELEKFDPIEEYHFNGKLVVLINGGVVSAGGTAAGLFKEYTNAILVGRETSGYAGTGNGVQKISILGGHTETAITIPLLHGVYAINPIIQKRGAIPDYEISNSVQDVLENRDAAMEFVFKNLLKIKTK